MVDLGPDAGSSLAGRFVDGTTLRAGRLAVLSVAAVATALVAVWNTAVSEAAAFMGWLVSTPWLWWYDVLETTVGGGFARLLGPAIDAAAAWVAGLGLLALPAGFATALAAWYAGVAAWRWLF